MKTTQGVSHIKFVRFALFCVKDRGRCHDYCSIQHLASLRPQAEKVMPFLGKI